MHKHYLRFIICLTVSILYADEILKSVEQVYFGGPVMVERGIVLHSSHYQSVDSIKISNDFFFTN